MSIIATNITKTFGKYRALDDVSIEVASGGLVALLGPSGSGKTTLLRILAGLELPDEGTPGKVIFHERDVTRLAPGKRNVGMVFQHYALFRHMTVFENIAFGLKVRPRSRRPAKGDIKKRVQELLDLVQLGELAGRYPSQLSGGQRQRIALARALAVEPDVLLLDEPFGALDARVRKDLRKWLKEFHSEIHISTIFVTHDQEEALELADTVVVMNHSKIEQIGAPEKVYDEPATPFVFEFLGDTNKLHSPQGPIYVRPHDIWIHREEPADVQAFRGQVVSINNAGPISKVRMKMEISGEEIEATIPRSAQEALGLNPGEKAYLRFLHPHRYRSDDTPIPQAPHAEVTSLEPAGKA